LSEPDTFLWLRISGSKIRVSRTGIPDPHCRVGGGSDSLSEFPWPTGASHGKNNIWCWRPARTAHEEESYIATNRSPNVTRSAGRLVVHAGAPPPKSASASHGNEQDHALKRSLCGRRHTPAPAYGIVRWRTRSPRDESYEWGEVKRRSASTLIHDGFVAPFRTLAPHRKADLRLRASISVAGYLRSQPESCHSFFSLGPVGIHRELITAAARWIMAEKL
jgi:hypothetical protein